MIMPLLLIISPCDAAHAADMLMLMRFRRRHAAAVTMPLMPCR